MLTAMKLARLRKSAQQMDIARLAGVSESLISKLETRRIRATPELQARLALMLGTQREELFDDDGWAKLAE